MLQSTPCSSPVRVFEPEISYNHQDGYRTSSANVDKNWLITSHPWYVPRGDNIPRKGRHPQNAARVEASTKPDVSSSGDGVRRQEGWCETPWETVWGAVTSFRWLPYDCHFRRPSAYKRDMILVGQIPDYHISHPRAQLSLVEQWSRSRRDDSGMNNISIPEGGQYIACHMVDNISIPEGGQYIACHMVDNISIPEGGQYIACHMVDNISIPEGGQYIACHMVDNISIPEGGQYIACHMIDNISIPEGGQYIAYHMVDNISIPHSGYYIACHIWLTILVSHTVDII